MKKIKYLSYYAKRNNSQKRNYVLSATNKMDYIISAINDAGYDVEIISASATRDKLKSYPGSLEKINEHTKLRLFYTFPWGNKLQKLLSMCTMNIFLFLELFKLKKGEPIIVYHSLGYMRVVELAHKIRKFYLILEVEELYSDVLENNELRKKEINFTRRADSYIFPTSMLSKISNPTGKPEILIHGTYQVEEERKNRGFDYNLQEGEKHIIHCVYAGTLDPRKGGAVAAAAATEFLPSNYYIHILGFGSDQDIQKMKDFITKIAERSVAKVTYDGLFSGEEYIQFIQNCDIGLSTQNPDAAFNGTSFPSKILSYMANGLHVVSIRIPAIETSAVGNKLFYYDEQTPENIAKAIVSVDLDQKYDGRQVVRDLSDEFKKEISYLLKERIDKKIE